jgi:superfamily II DNA or RNA helicase
VRRTDRTSTGGLVIDTIGLSELVRDKQAIFLEEIEPAIKVLEPAETQLVPDTSSSYRASLLYIESLLRQTPPTDEHIYIGHKAAMDTVPYQLDPALQALKQPRQRILIADGVGLGKTLEAGILISELIKRGKGKRILVLTVKSMMTQFQKELWSRFTIPLVRLDSDGILRVRSEIPTNHNPFYYYDKTIISIDTLKQDREYRTYIEGAYWDIIVIDEAHNVAERGTNSLRSRLAQLISRKSDTLIMLSATPHDGRARSFASLMNMLDPTAIADPDHYGPDDIKGLCIRRFKKDVKDQVEQAFKQRRIFQARKDASVIEEEVFEFFTRLTFKRIDQKRGGEQLFKTTLEKALFSSPAACIQTIDARIKKLDKSGNQFADDIKSLVELKTLVQKLTPEHFSRYQKCLDIIRNNLRWDGRDTTDRLVVFTERIETMRFLEKNLPQDLGLREGQTEILHGTMSDKDQQDLVEEFGKEQSDLRLLIASDVASEGINLHYLSHKMIHFDIPWALMVFQQRNGRIDRYGQKFNPEICYLLTESRNTKIKGDMRILELLIQKDNQAVENIGDPSTLMGVFDIDKQESVTALAIETGQSVDQFEKSMEVAAFDPLAHLVGETTVQQIAPEDKKPRSIPSVFSSDFDYVTAAIDFLRGTQPIQAEWYTTEQRIDLTAPSELAERFDHLPKEVYPDNGQFVLTASLEKMKEEFERCRKYKSTWPRIQYLWEQHPIVQWINDKVTTSFRRQKAPVITLPEKQCKGDIIFILSGLIPNRKGHPLVHQWFGAVFNKGQYKGIETIETILNKTNIGRTSFPNSQTIVDLDGLRALLPEAVKKAREWISKKRLEFENTINPKLNDHLKDLERLRARQHQQLELKFSDLTESAVATKQRRDREQRGIDNLFDDYLKWVEDTMTTEDRAYVQVIAVLQGAQ